MAFNPDETQKGKETNGPQVGDAPSGKPIGSLVEAVFSNLNITPCNWQVLFSLPFLAVTHELSARPTKWGLFGRYAQWPTSEKDWDGFFIRVKQCLSNIPYACESDATVRVSEIVRLDKVLHPKGQPDEEKCEKGSALLCWHLAKAYDAAKRDHILSVFSAGWDLLDNSVDAKIGLKDFANKLRVLIDVYLPASTFTHPAEQAFASLVSPKIPEAPSSDLGCLAILPIAAILDGHRFREPVLREVIRRLLNQPLQNTELGKFLEPAWARLIRDLLLPLGEDLNGKNNGYTGESNKHNLVQWLAHMDLEPRQRLLCEIGHFFDSMIAEYPFIPRLSQKRINEYFKQLRFDIENFRHVPPVAVDPPLGMPKADSKIPADVTAKVCEAKPFKTVGLEEICKRNREITISRIEQHLLSASLLFTGVDGSLIARPRESDVPLCLWFVGDLHGDPLALENAWEFASARSKQEGQLAHVIFLGDFVDRGQYSHETLLSLFRLIFENPGRIGIVVGNHDENFQWDETTATFLSGIDPAEYPAELNRLKTKADPDSRFRFEVGRQACEFFKRCPRAIFLPDGLLVAHGGFPHKDLHDSLISFDDLNKDACLQDFVWLRASPNSPRKIPNRGSRGCDFGYEDFACFCKQMQKLGQPVLRLIRGHDHVPERCIQYTRYVTHPVITINSMCRKLEDEVMNDQFPKACLARYIKDKLPIVYKLPIDQREIQKAFFAGKPGA